MIYDVIWVRVDNMPIVGRNAEECMVMIMIICWGCFY